MAGGPFDYMLHHHLVPNWIVLQDMVAFGAAPAMIIVSQLGLHNLGKIGWLISICVLPCAGLVFLARFNVMIGVDKVFSKGFLSAVSCSFSCWLCLYFVLRRFQFKVLSLF